jgi:hypothetical protein
VNPYGVYDQTLNTGGVRVGTDPDPAAFAVQSLRTWGRQMGQASDPEGTELLVTAAGGGSNGSRCRLWKTELQRCADETGRAVRVCPFPPGTSKGNKSEHRRFCHLTQNGRGRPLVSHEASVPLSGSTTTRTGLTIRAGLDTGRYPTGLKGADDELAAVQLTRTEFHGDWNYSITPRCSATIG